MDDIGIREAIDACRPGGDDLQSLELEAVAAQIQGDPQLRQRFEQLQNLDRTIGREFRQVDVPDGLEERLLARLAWEGEPAESEPVTPAASDRRTVTRRELLWRIGLAASAVAAVVVIGVMYLKPPAEAPPLFADDLTSADSVAKILAAVDEDAWQTTDPTFDGYPQSRYLLVPFHAWQRIATEHDPEAMVYDITPPGGPDALLFVLRPRGGVRDDSQSGPPATPASTTGGQSLAAWHEKDNDLVYLLVISGPGHDKVYLRMTRPGDLAWIPRRVLLACK